MDEEDNLNMDREESDDEEDADKLEEVGSGSRSRRHPCRFCSEVFTSELRLILHFREEHLEPEDEEEWSSESESDPDEASRSPPHPRENEFTEEDTTPALDDFVTDYERALLKEPVAVFRPPHLESEEEDSVHDGDTQEIDSDPEEEEGDEGVTTESVGIEDEILARIINDDDKIAEVGSDPRSRHHPCRFCSASFTSELRLILHFRDQHLDPGDEEESSSENGAELEDDLDSAEEEEMGEGPCETSMLDFVTDYEMTLLKEPLLHPNPASEGEDEDAPGVGKDIGPENELADQPDETSLELGEVEDQSHEVINGHGPSRKPSGAQMRESGSGSRRPTLSKTMPTNKKTAVKKASPIKGPPEQGYRFVCVFCDKGFFVENRFWGHIRGHTKETPYFCKLCNASFGLDNYLTRHMKKYHPDMTPYQCKLCPKSFSTQRKLTDHMQTHWTARDFECEDCKKRFKWKCDLTRHMKTCHSGGRVQRDQCELCKKTFSRRNELYRHMRAVHKQPMTAHPVSNRERLFACEHCEERFTRNFDMKRHVKMFH